MGKPAGKSSTKRVLILNPDREAASAMEEMLKDLGCAHETARSCSEAVMMCAKAKTEGRPFSVLLVDATAVTEANCAAAQKMRAIDASVKLVFAQGPAGGLPLSEWGKWGFSVSLPHPVRPNELARVLA